MTDYFESRRVQFPVACHERFFGLGVRYPAACRGVVHFMVPSFSILLEKSNFATEPVRAHSDTVCGTCDLQE